MTALHTWWQWGLAIILAPVAAVIGLVLVGIVIHAGRWWRW